MNMLCKLLIFGCTVGAAPAGDWPRWRGPGGDGRWNPQSVPANVAMQEPERLWEVEVGGGYSGVTVAGGKVYLMDRPQSPG